MALFNLFKKTKKGTKGPGKKQEKKELDDYLKTGVVREETKGVAARAAKKAEKKQFNEAYRILDSVHVTEKSTSLSERGVYVFKVKPQANKPEIKKAIQDLYGVKVEKVAIINVPEKFRRLSRYEGKKSGYKKALVKLTAGEKIEIMPR